MKKYVVYYSRTGKNKRLAEYISKKFDISKEEIVDKVNRKGYWGFLKSGFATMTRMGTKILPTKIDPVDYDLAIVVAPIWVGVLPPAIRTYLKKNRLRLRDILLVSVSGVGKENKMLYADIKLALGKKPLMSLLFSEEEYEKDLWQKKIDDLLASIKNVSSSSNDKKNE